MTITDVNVEFIKNIYCELYNSIFHESLHDRILYNFDNFTHSLK